MNEKKNKDKVHRNSCSTNLFVAVHWIVESTVGALPSVAVKPMNNKNTDKKNTVSVHVK